MKKHLLEMELYKIRREIEMHGGTYDILRERKDERGEATGEYEKLLSVKGLFHTSKSYISEMYSDSGTVRTKGQPMLLVDCESVKGIIPGDMVRSDYLKSDYKITDINNIQEYDMIVDISLEVILNGTN